MLKKINRKILFSILIVIILVGGCFWYFFQEKEKIASQKESEKIVPDSFFTKRIFYSWNGITNNFDIEEKTISDNYFRERADLHEEQADLNNNSILENYILKNGKMIVKEKEKIIWQSSDDWQIVDFVLADSNNDGIIDLNLSLWKPGNFGVFKPFWVKKNDMRIKNHFFVYDLVGDSLKQVWCSSNLSKPNCEFKIADINGDGENELIVIEGDYLKKFECNGNFVAVWKWNSWGFFNEWRSEKGNFSNLEIVNNNITAEFF